MPKFRLPSVQKNSREDYDEIACDQDWRRRITIPANKAIMDEMEVDEEVTIVLKGKVIETVERAGETYSESHFEINVDEVDAYKAGDDRINDLLDDDE